MVSAVMLSYFALGCFISTAYICLAALDEGIIYHDTMHILKVATVSIVENKKIQENQEA
jgi:hypothetical protein